MTTEPALTGSDSPQDQSVGVQRALAKMGEPPSKLELAWFFVARGLVEVASRLVWGVRVTGRENLPTNTPYVLAPVHRSYVDTLLVGCISRRRVRYMGKDAMWKMPLAGALFSSLGAFPVRRGTPDREALRACEAAIRAGEPVVLFPEGTRREGPVVHPLFEGAAFVASRCGVPIVPVGIAGSEEAMPKDSSKIRRSRVNVCVGEPIWPPQRPEGARVPRRVVSEITSELQTSLQDVFDKALVQRAGRRHL